MQYSLQDGKMTDVSGKNVVVTGADKATGRRIAMELGKSGANLALIGSDALRVFAVADEIVSAGGQAFAICTDVFEWYKADNAFLSILSVFPHIDILINSIDIQEGPYPIDSIESIEQEWDNFASGTLKGAFFCCRIVLDHMRSQNYGRIVNIAQPTLNSFPDQATPLQVAKASIKEMTRALAAEVANANICVNAIVPENLSMPLSRDTGYRVFSTVMERQRSPVEGKSKPFEEVLSALDVFLSDGMDYASGFCHNVSQNDKLENPFVASDAVDVSADETSIQFRYNPLEHLSSWPTVLHGGVITSLLDEAVSLAGVACFKGLCFTVSLDVRFHTIVQTNTELTISATRVRTTRRLITVEAEIASQDGTVHASAVGKVIKAAD